MPFLCRGADAAIQEYQRAIDLNPNFAAAHGYLGYALAMAERTDEGIAHLKQAIQMSPQDTQNAIFNMGLSVAHYLAGRYAEAVTFGQKAVQQRDGITAGHRIYLASLAQAGRVEEARIELSTLRSYSRTSPLHGANCTFPTHRRRWPSFSKAYVSAGVQ
jgi:tetratricopeptide (TPR) repeat protein